MHVLHLVPALFDADDGIIGGAERYVYELARHMARVTPTTLVTFGSHDRREARDGLSIVVLGRPWYPRGQRANPVSFKLFAQLRGADVVHCHQQHILSSTLAAAYCRLTRRPVFVTDLGGGGWDVSAYISTDRWYRGRLHLSQYSRGLAHGASDADHVILGGVDSEKFAPRDDVQRGRTILFVGRLLPHKGIDTLIEALAPGMQLQIIGHESEPRYSADLHKLAQGKAVTFRHDCDDDALIEAYRQAACVVLPSVYRTMYGDESRVPELLGQTLLEAMACGAPTICSNVASLPEIVQDGVTGLIVPEAGAAALRTALSWMLDHPAQAAAMGRAGRRRILQHFTWPQVVARCLRIYRCCDSAS
ncbi:MAG TPA: glycosyltransferase family 4 protein [Candidatus Binataceae bacterium]|nr:glycosyltransferase family 4 protein [Candidatus Binataceae bacterium]